MKKSVQILFLGIFFVGTITTNAQISTGTGGESNVLPNNPTTNTNVGIGTDNPTAKLEVVGDIKAKQGFFTNSLPNGSVFTDWADRNDKCLVFGAGSLLGTGYLNTRMINFFDFPASNLDPKSLVWFSIDDRSNNSRFRVYAETAGTGTFTLHDKSQAEYFRVYDDGNDNFYMHFPRPNSRIVIGGYGDYLPEHKFVVRGSAKIEGNILTDANISASSYTGGASLTGTPTAPTAPAGTNTAQIATTQFVTSAVNLSNNDVVHKSGNETITGLKTFNWGGSGLAPDGIRLNNTGSGYGTLISTNSGTGDGPYFINTDTVGPWSAAAYFENNGTGVNSSGLQVDNKGSIGVRLYNAPTSTSNLLNMYNNSPNPNAHSIQVTNENGTGDVLRLLSTGSHNGFLINTSSNAKLNKNGDWIATSFIKSGGTSTQFLKADGSVDSTIYAQTASPAFTGTPTAPTPTAGTNTTQIATTQFVNSAVSLSENNVVHKTGTESISGNKIFSNGGFTAINVSTNAGSNPGLVVSGTASSTANVFEGRNNGTPSFTLTKLGVVTGTSFVKSGVTSTNLLLAGGDDIPQSTFVQTASPAFTGTPTAPTPTAGTNTTQIATTQFVTSAVNLSYNDVVHKTGTEAISGNKTFSNGGFTAINVSTNYGSNPGFVTNGSASSTANIFEGRNDGTPTFTLTKLGTATGTSFVKSGATATNLLLAGGGDISQSTFIQNQNASAQSANMWISGNGYFGGNVGIGSVNPDSKLTVKGKIHAEEVKIDLNVPADYVFQKYYTGTSSLKSDYVMPSLAEVEKYTKENHHLPTMPSAQEIKDKGLQLGEMSNLLLQKVEELTLYAIEQQKELERLKKENENYKSLAERLSLIEKELKK